MKATFPSMASKYAFPPGKRVENSVGQTPSPTFDSP